MGDKSSTPDFGVGTRGLGLDLLHFTQIRLRGLVDSIFAVEADEDRVDTDTGLARPGVSLDSQHFDLLGRAVGFMKSRREWLPLSTPSSSGFGVGSADTATMRVFSQLWSSLLDSVGFCGAIVDAAFRAASRLVSRLAWGLGFSRADARSFRSTERLA